MSENRDIFYASKVFLFGVTPLLKTILAERPNLQKGWKNKKAICQISCIDNNEKDGIHFIFEDSVCTPKKGALETVDLELEFSSRTHLVNFFKGKSLPMPKIKGAMKNFSVFLNFMKLLLFMAKLLGYKKPPKSVEDQKLLVKCMFYLLSRGINILNKLDHPEVKKWTQNSPDRVYAWAVEGFPDISAHIRIMKGRSKAKRGLNTTTQPFFTMKFDTILSALGILQNTDDMIESTIQEKLIMIGGPEFGAQLGDCMLLVAGLVQ